MLLVCSKLIRLKAPKIIFRSFFICPVKDQKNLINAIYRAAHNRSYERQNITPSKRTPMGVLSLTGFISKIYKYQKTTVDIYYRDKVSKYQDCSLRWVKEFDKGKPGVIRGRKVKGLTFCFEFRV